MGPKRMPSIEERLDLFHISVDTVEIYPTGTLARIFNVGGRRD